MRQGVHTPIEVHLQLDPGYDHDVDVEGEGGVGGVQLVVVALLHQERLQFGEVTYCWNLNIIILRFCGSCLRDLVPGEGRPINAVPCHYVSRAILNYQTKRQTCLY